MRYMRHDGRKNLKRKIDSYLEVFWGSVMMREERAGWSGSNQTKTLRKNKENYHGT